MRKNRHDPSADYNENVDFDVLIQHTYDDAPGHVFYTCPICHGEYLATFITEEKGKAMCIDCWQKNFGS